MHSYVLPFVCALGTQSPCSTSIGTLHGVLPLNLGEGGKEAQQEGQEGGRRRGLLGLSAPDLRRIAAPRSKFFSLLIPIYLAWTPPRH